MARSIKQALAARGAPRSHRFIRGYATRLESQRRIGREHDISYGNSDIAKETRARARAQGNPRETIATRFPSRAILHPCGRFARSLYDTDVGRAGLGKPAARNL